MFVCLVCAGVRLESAYFVVSMLAAVKTMYLNSTYCKCQWRLFTASMFFSSSFLKWSIFIHYSQNSPQKCTKCTFRGATVPLIGKYLRTLNFMNWDQI